MIPHLAFFRLLPYSSEKAWTFWPPPLKWGGPKKRGSFSHRLLPHTPIVYPNHKGVRRISVQFGRIFAPIGQKFVGQHFWLHKLESLPVDPSLYGSTDAFLGINISRERLQPEMRSGLNASIEMRSTTVAKGSVGVAVLLFIYSSPEE